MILLVKGKSTKKETGEKTEVVLISKLEESLNIMVKKRGEKDQRKKLSKITFHFLTECSSENKLSKDFFSSFLAFFFLLTPSFL